MFFLFLFSKAWNLETSAMVTIKLLNNKKLSIIKKNKYCILFVKHYLFL